MLASVVVGGCLGLCVLCVVCGVVWCCVCLCVVVWCWLWLCVGV